MSETPLVAVLGEAKKVYSQNLRALVISYEIYAYNILLLLEYTI